MEPKLVTKPITRDEIIDKSRHLTGFNRWARSSKTVGTIMLVLEWFTVPFEVLFRKDFGQRWLTPINFLFGWILLAVIYALQKGWTAIVTYVEGILHPLHALATSPEVIDNEESLKTLSALLIFHFYIGAYHLFKIKWRNQANIALHSYDNGTSRFIDVAKILVIIINLISIPFLFFYWILIPRSQRKGKPYPKLIHNADAFTSIIIEPAIVIYLAYISTSVTRFYLGFTALTLFIAAQRREMARKTKALDFQDSKMEAQMMKEWRTFHLQEKPAKKVVKKADKKVIARQEIKISYPPLHQIIESWYQQQPPLLHITNGYSEKQSMIARIVSGLRNS